MAKSRELTVLRTLKETAVGIRARFLANQLRKEGEGGVDVDSAIHAGNGRAPGPIGDVLTDICLFENTWWAMLPA